MSTLIKLKKSSVSGNVPAPNDLQYGELALNFADGKLFYKNSANEIKSFIDSALVTALIEQTSIDSAAISGIVDSSYVQLRQDFSYASLTGTPNILDSTDVSGIITTNVNQTFVNNLNIDAVTLGGNDSSYYLNYNNFTILRSYYEQKR